MANSTWGANPDPYTPEGVRSENSGLRPSMARIMALIDTEDPIFPKVAETLRSMVDAGVDLDESAVTIAIKMARRSIEQETEGARTLPRHPLPEESDDDARSIVYYIRRGELIKIGRTVNPKKRFEALLPDEILAFEPGGARTETIRHRQFIGARKGNSEYFRQTADLLEHIAATRAEHGRPDPTWRTTANIGYRLPGTEAVLAPELGLGTAIVAADEIGVRRCTIYSWIHRGKLKPAGRNDRGKALYRLGDVWVLKQRSPAYRDMA